MTTTYAFGGAVVAQRESDGSVTYLHGDHLGSVSVQTDTQGSATPNGKQEYDPWGALRSGGIAGTTPNYAGQRRTLSRRCHRQQVGYIVVGASGSN